MKKIIAIIALLVSAGAAYGAASTNWSYGTSGVFTMGGTKSLDVKPSANVGFAYNGGTAGVAYTVASYHAQGSRCYATSSTDTNIFYLNITAPGIGTALSSVTLPAPPAPPAGVDWTTNGGWSASK